MRFVRLSDSQRSNLLWKGIALAAGTIASALADKIVSLLWKKVTGAEEPIYRVVGWTTRRREIVWIAVSGLAYSLGRLVVLRGCARVWRAKTGRYPAPLVESPAA